MSGKWFTREGESLSWIDWAAAREGCYYLSIADTRQMIWVMTDIGSRVFNNNIAILKENNSITRINPLWHLFLKNKPINLIIKMHLFEVYLQQFLIGCNRIIYNFDAKYI